MGLCGTATPILQDMGSSATHKDRDSQISHGVTHLFLSANCHFWTEGGFINLVLWAGWVSFKVSKATSWTILCRGSSVCVGTECNVRWYRTV